MKFIKLSTNRCMHAKYTKIHPHKRSNSAHEIKIDSSRKPYAYTGNREISSQAPFHHRQPSPTWLREGHETSFNDTFNHSPISSSSSLYGATSSILVHVDNNSEVLFYACVGSFGSIGHPESATSFSEVLDNHYQCNLTIILACRFFTHILHVSGYS